MANQPKQQEERLNPKYVQRRMMELLPDGVPDHLIVTLFALWAHSNGILKADDLDAGRVDFTAAAAHSQLMKFCRNVKTIRAMQRRMEELRKLGIVTAVRNGNPQKGNVYQVFYQGHGPKTAVACGPSRSEEPTGHGLESSSHGPDDARSRSSRPSSGSGSVASGENASGNSSPAQLETQKDRTETSGTSSPNPKTGFYDDPDAEERKANVPVTRQGAALPRDPALTGDHRGDPVPPSCRGFCGPWKDGVCTRCGSPCAHPDEHPRKPGYCRVCVMPVMFEDGLWVELAASKAFEIVED